MELTNVVQKNKLTMKPSVSFIIPYYNIESHLLMRAIESVRSVCSFIDWELIIIDDGTPDTTARQLVDKFNDKHIRYYFQNNSGVANARNHGMEMARNEYILFLDADDCLIEAPMQECIKILIKEHPDMLTFRHVKTNGIHMEKTACKNNKIVYRGQGYEYMSKHNICGSPWHYFFKKDLAKGLAFPEDIYHEDEEFTALIYLRPETLIVTNITAYAYYQRPGSRMHQKEQSEIEKHYSDFITVITHLQNVMPTLPPSHRKALRRRTDMLCGDLIYNLVMGRHGQLSIKDTVHVMRQKGFYPLNFRPYTWQYLCICIVASNMVSINLAYQIASFIHFFKKH